MSWGGVDAIPLRKGESRRAAVDRVYSGGAEIVVEDDGVRFETIPGPDRDITKVTNAEHGWMVQAVQIMEELRPGWEVVEEERERGRRWPWHQILENPRGSMWLSLGPECITFKVFKYTDVDDESGPFGGEPSGALPGYRR